MINDFSLGSKMGSENGSKFAALMEVKKDDITFVLRIALNFTFNSKEVEHLRNFSMVIISLGILSI